MKHGLTELFNFLLHVKACVVSEQLFNDYLMFFHHPQLFFTGTKKKSFVFSSYSYFIFYSAVQDNQVTSFNSLFFVCVLEMLGFDLSICLFEYQLFKVNILYSLLFF